MTREVWNRIRRSKGFYIRTYRRTISALILSICLNLVLCFVIYYAHFNQKESDFYATNGVTPPVELTALSSANNTSIPLLASDQDRGGEIKVIPK